MEKEKIRQLTSHINVQVIRFGKKKNEDEPSIQMPYLPPIHSRTTQ